MGPTYRPFAYRDPWWDPTGRVARRRRRRRAALWLGAIALGAAIGINAGQARAAELTLDGHAPLAAVSRSGPGAR